MGRWPNFHKTDIVYCAIFFDVWLGKFNTSNHHYPNTQYVFRGDTHRTLQTLTRITLLGVEGRAQRDIIYIKTPIPLRARAELLIITQASSCKPGLSPENHMWFHLFKVKETKAHVSKQRDRLEQVGKLPLTCALCIVFK